MTAEVLLGTGYSGAIHPVAKEARSTPGYAIAEPVRPLVKRLATPREWPGRAVCPARTIKPGISIA
jgi:hypothetical protein